MKTENPPRLMRDSERLVAGLEDLIKWIGDTHDSLLVEIGSWIGKSTVIFSKSFREVIAVDPHMVKFTAEHFHRRCDTIPNISHISQPSIKASRQFELQSIDVVYIDANHSYEAVKSDLIHWLPLIKDGGVVCGHDYLRQPQWRPWMVKEAVNEILGGPDETFQDNSWAVRVDIQRLAHTILL